MLPLFREIVTRLSVECQVVLSLGASSGGDATVAQSDGKILVAGTSSAAEGFTLVRLNSNGSLDETFGTRGVAIVGSGEQI